MSSKVFCIGEVLIDMVCVDGKGLKEGVVFEKKAGGAPANVSCAIAKLQGNAYFLGQVGDDMFGEFLIDTLRETGVNTSMVSKDGVTTMALVGIDETGERSFNFLRGSDSKYIFSSINLSEISKHDIIHFGSATAYLEGDLRDTYFKLLDYAIENDIYVSFDPNYRDALITSDKLEDFIQCTKRFLKYSDFVKLSLEELTLITGEEDLNSGIKTLKTYGPRVICITLGDKGCILNVGGKNIEISSIKIDQVDSTGAGDAFVGGVLTEVSKICDKKNINIDAWKEIVFFANKVGAITCTKYGAINSMPTLTEIQ